MALPQETNLRSTDVLADVEIQRIGIDGSGSNFLKEALQKIDQALGSPLEIYPTYPAESNALNYRAAEYTLPDGRKLVAMKGGVIPSILDGSITFDLPSNTGTITSGTNLSFPIPALADDDFVNVLIQFSFGRNAIKVTFGTPQNANPVGLDIPELLTDYEPLVLAALHVTGTQFDAIFRSNLKVVKDTLDPDSAPKKELQEVTVSPKSVFTLTTFLIPTERERLAVFVNGVRQTDQYVVNSDTEVQFGSAIPVTGKVLFEVV